MNTAGFDVQRQARNGIHYSTDVAGTGIVVEVKRRRGSLLLDTWMKQALASRRQPDDIAVVLARSDRGQWLLCMPLQDFPSVARLRESHRVRAVLRDIETATDCRLPQC